MIAANLPALQVVVPLIAAPVCVLLRGGRAAWALATAITWAAFAIAIALLVQVMESGTISYAVGGWQPPWGIEIRVDLLSALMLVVVSGIGSIVMPFARASIEREVAPERVYLLYVMYLLCLTGLLGIAITGDAFNLFVFLEISSLSSYVMISLGRDRRALTAAYRYLIMGTIGATFYLIGIGLMYMVTGTLNIVDLAERVPPLLGNRTIQMALAFLLVGISLKVALYPLHLWLPNAYAYAPSAVTVFLAGTATKVALYALIRVTYSIFGGPNALDGGPIREVFMVLGMVAMIVSSLIAVFQNDVKRLLAYSSLAQIGYMMLGAGLANVPGLAGGLVHIFNHALIKATLFMAIGCVFYRIGACHVHDLAGLGRRMPVTMAAMVVGGLSLIGVPLTVGFITKWYLVQGALELDRWPVAVVVLGSGLLALIYFWRLVEAAYFRPPPADAGDVKEAPLSMLVPLWLLAVGCLYFGIDATLPAGLALDTADLLLGGGRP